MKKNWKFWTACVFVALEVAIFVVALFVPGYGKLSYAATCLAFVFAFVYVNKNARVWLTICALLFTVVSDWFLVLRMPFDQQTAMTTFLIAQLCYATRLVLNEKSKKTRVFHIALVVALTVTAICVTKFVLGDSFDYLSAISVAYFANIILNTIFAFVQIKKSPIFAVGMLLFLCCDTLVGLNSAIGVYIDVPETSLLYQISHLPFDLATACYIPSQALIAFSCRDCK